MSKYIKQTLSPYIGLGDIKLGMKLSDAREILKSEKISFSQWNNPNKGCIPEVPWTYIKFDSCITLCFAKDILWSISCEEGFEGILPNNIRIGMCMEDALKIDDTLSYNDDDEDFISGQGYWLEEEIESGNVATFTVFIKEAENSNFFDYTWCNRY